MAEQLTLAQGVCQFLLNEAFECIFLFPVPFLNFLSDACIFIYLFIFFDSSFTLF
jgi:hypothetical protein